MRRALPLPVVVALTLVTLYSVRVTAQQPATLTDEEEDALREAQDPGDRIKVYVDLTQTRLTQFDDFRKKPQDPKYDSGAYLDKLLAQYLALDEEMKNWIDDQFQRNGDMRKGLRVLVEKGPQQLVQLRQIEQTPDAYAADYKDTLRDAIDDLNDTLNGATQALAEQEKKFAALKREGKAETRLERGGTRSNQVPALLTHETARVSQLPRSCRRSRSHPGRGYFSSAQTAAVLRCSCPRPQGKLPELRRQRQASR